MHDWIVKHDIDGDKNIIKTILDRGVGYDRPFELCEIKIDLKIYTKIGDVEVVYREEKDLETTMTDREVIGPLVKKIINSMKKTEKVSCLIKSSYLESLDPLLV